MTLEEQLKAAIADWYRQQHPGQYPPAPPAEEMDRAEAAWS